MADNTNGDADREQTESEKLVQFQDLTRIEDVEHCRNILTQHDWNLEVAVRETLNFPDMNPRQDGHLSNSETPPYVHSISPRIYGPLIPNRRPQGLFQWLYYVLRFPFDFVITSIWGILSFAYRIFRPDSRRNVTDPLGDVVSFITQYEATYGDIHPRFYQGTYSQALNEAKRDLQFLLVYLHGDEHQDTPKFCSETLSDPNVIEYVNNNMLFWACSVALPEGYRVSQALRENGYPFLALIVLKHNLMTVVARLEGPCDPQNLLNRLQLLVSDNEAAIVSARAEREERNLNQTLRRDQDLAYEASLRADQEKERRRREAQDLRAQQEQEETERLEREQEEIREREREEYRRKEEIARQKIDFADRVPTEPPVGDTAIRLCIKLPNGTRLDRRFLKNESIKGLYYFVFCHPESPNSFKIETSFPRRTVPCVPTEEMPEPETFTEVGLKGSEVLYVHDLEA